MLWNSYGLNVIGKVGDQGGSTGSGGSRAASSTRRIDGPTCLVPFGVAVRDPPGTFFARYNPTARHLRMSI